MQSRDPYDLLLPRPTRVVRPGGSVTRGALDRPEVTTHDPRISPGAYTLEVSESGPALCAADDSGIRHAKATLAQIRRLPGDALPAASITDTPALARRGVMLDVSRNRIPKADEFARIASMFQALKLDHAQCYTEHAFAYTGHETVWDGADPITPDEARSLDALFARHGVELAANQNCFGHLTRWLTHPAYAHLAETQGDWDFAGMPRSGPFSLCPTDERSLPFIEGLLDELLPCFDSPFINIGCDETYDIGQGRSANTVDRDGKAAVYGRFVGAVCRAAIARGKTPMFWADIAREHPRALDHIPPEAHALVWGYEPDHDFLNEAAMHREANRPWWVCPGTSSWRGFTGRSLERQTNIRNAANAAVAGGAAGMLITDWGDFGHRQVWPITMLAIAEGADAAWTGKPRGGSFLEAVSLHVFGDPSLTIASWLEDLGDTDEPIRRIAGPRAQSGTPARLANATAHFTELHPPPLPLHLPDDPKPWRECRDRLTDLAKRIPTGAGPLIEAELAHAIGCARWATDVALSRRGDTTATTTSGTLKRRRDSIKAEHARLWTERSRPGGLTESLACWDQPDLDTTR